MKKLGKNNSCSRGLNTKKNTISNKQVIIFYKRGPKTTGYNTRGVDDY
jgi:TnpA family transposase